MTAPDEKEAAQILSLYRAAGWWQAAAAADIRQVRAIVRGSHCFLVATRTEEKEIVGMGRAISDGASDAYIQDVVVAPAHRGGGIASRIIECLVSRLRADGLEWIGLIAERNTQVFYRRLGFSPMAEATPMLYRKT